MCVAIAISTRQSRSRGRQQRHQERQTIDRETVLKINRHPTRRHRSCAEYEWPPPNESRPHVNTNTQRFNNKALSKRQVGEIREFFDNYERNVKELWEMSNQWTTNKQVLSDSTMTSSKSAENLEFFQQQHDDFVCGIDKKLLMNWERVRKNQSCLTSLSSSASNLLEKSTLLHAQTLSPRSISVCRPPLLLPLSPRKCFYLPEEKIHSNESVVKIRQHFDKSHDKQRHSSGICNVDSASNQNKIGKTKNHNSTNTDYDYDDDDYASDMKYSSHSLEMHRCKNDGVSTSASLFNECDQKIFHLNESATTTTMSTLDMLKINETPITTVKQPPPLEEPLCCQASELHKHQQSALIKNDNISCGNGKDLKDENRKAPHCSH